MKGNTIIFVVLSGLFFLPACFHLYIIVDKAVTWPEAQSYCRRNFADLATVSSGDDMNNLVVAAQDYYNDHLWIGLYDDINSWKWSLQRLGFYGEGETDFRKWRNGEPNNYWGLEDCVEKASDGWNDCGCNIPHPFVCYHEIGNSVPSSNYVLVNDLKNWSDAQSYCRQHYIDLVSVRNQTEDSEVTTVSQNQQVWLGLYRNSWEWSDGSPTTFKQGIPPPDPNFSYMKDSCVVLHKGQWETQKCQDKFSFICNPATVTQQIVKLTLTKNVTFVDLEDATEAILQQFREILKDNGVTEDVQLTWRTQPNGKVFHLDKKEEKKPEDLICSFK